MFPEPHLIIQAAKMSEHKYEFEITMTCGGCSGAVDRVLKKLEGEFFSSSFFAGVACAPP